MSHRENIRLIARAPSQQLPVEFRKNYGVTALFRIGKMVSGLLFLYCS